MKTQKCPFCRMDVEDNADIRDKHRKPGGECDIEYARRKALLNEAMAVNSEWKP